MSKVRAVALAMAVFSVLSIFSGVAVEMTAAFFLSFIIFVATDYVLDELREARL